MMKDTIVLNIYSAKFYDWIIVNTEKGLYSLRVGGFKRETELEVDEKDEIDFPYKNKKVIRIYSDDEWTYYLLDGGGIIVSGIVSISGEGMTDRGVRFSNSDEYDVEMFKSSDFWQIVEGADGWSKKI